MEEGGGVEGGLRRVRAPPLSKGGMRTGEMRSYGTEASVQWAWYIIDTEASGLGTAVHDMVQLVGTGTDGTWRVFCMQ